MPCSQNRLLRQPTLQQTEELLGSAHPPILHLTWTLRAAVWDSSEYPLSFLKASRVECLHQNQPSPWIQLAEILRHANLKENNQVYTEPKGDHTYSQNLNNIYIFKVLDDTQVIIQDMKESGSHGRIRSLRGKALKSGYAQDSSPYLLQPEHPGSPFQLQTTLSYVLLSLIMDFSGQSQKAIGCL